MQYLKQCLIPVLVLIFTLACNGSRGSGSGGGGEDTGGESSDGTDISENTDISEDDDVSDDGSADDDDSSANDSDEDDDGSTDNGSTDDTATVVGDPECPGLMEPETSTTLGVIASLDHSNDTGSTLRFPCKYQENPPMVFISPYTGWVGCQTSGHIDLAVTHDGGVSWEEVPDEQAAVMAYSSHTKSSGTVYYDYESFTDLERDEEGNVYLATYDKIAKHDAVTCSYSLVYDAKTDDNASNSTDDSSEIAVTGDGVITRVADDQILWTSNDGGVTWTQSSFSEDPYEGRDDLYEDPYVDSDFHPSGGTFYYGGLAAFENDVYGLPRYQWYSSYNHDESHPPFFSFPNPDVSDTAYLQKLAIVDESSTESATAFAVTTNGFLVGTSGAGGASLYYSTDGNTWSEAAVTIDLGDGFSYQPVNVDDMKCHHDREVCLAVGTTQADSDSSQWGGLILISTDGGLNWENLEHEAIVPLTEESRYKRVTFYDNYFFILGDNSFIRGRFE